MPRSKDLENGNYKRNDFSGNHTIQQSYGSINHDDAFTYSAVEQVEPIMFESKQGFSESFSNTIKALTGSGINALPFAFLMTGWVEASLGMVVLALLSFFTMWQMIECTRIIRQKMKLDGESNGMQVPIGFREVGNYVFPTFGQLLVDIVLVVCQIGANCAFIPFIAGNLGSALLHFDIIVHPTILVWLIFIPLTGLALLPSTSLLANFSHVGNVALVIGIGTVFYVGYATSGTSSSTEFSFQGLRTWGGIDGLSVFLGIAAFALSAHAEVVAIHNEVKSSQQYNYVLALAVALTTVLYLIFSLFAFLRWKNQTESNIFLNLENSPYVVIVKMCMAVVVTFNYPLSLFPAMQTIDQWVLGSIDETKRIYIRPILRILTVGFTCLVATMLNDFGLLVSISGGLLAGILCFILPPAFHWALLYADNRHSFFIGILISIEILFGFSVFATGIVVAMDSAKMS